MLTKIRQLLGDESGATAIEYGLIAALVSVAAVVALGNLGQSLSTIFTSIGTTLNNAVSGSGSAT